MANVPVPKPAATARKTVAAVPAEATIAATASVPVPKPAPTALVTVVPVLRPPQPHPPAVTVLATVPKPALHVLETAVHVVEVTIVGTVLATVPKLAQLAPGIVAPVLRLQRPRQIPTQPQQWILEPMEAKIQLIFQQEAMLI